MVGPKQMVRVNRDIMAKVDKSAPWFWLATWFGCGLMLPAPGTWGTLGALPFAVAAMVLGGKGALFAFLVLSTAVGWWAADKFEKAAGAHDAPSIVIDEVAGVSLTLLFAPATPIGVALSFILFRVFDILKIWPASWVDEEMPGAAGVMVDDLVAGLMAGICVWGLRHVGIG